MLKLTQKTAVIDGKTIAFVEPLIINDKYSYKVTFDDKTKRRANVWFRSLGFKVGSVADGDTVPEKVVEL